MIYYMTGISTPFTHLVHVISYRLCSGWLKPGSASAHVCSGLLTYLTRHLQLLTRGPKRLLFPARIPYRFPLHFHNLCQPELIPRRSLLSARLYTKCVHAETFSCVLLQDVCSSRNKAPNTGTDLLIQNPWNKYRVETFNVYVPILILAYVIRCSSSRSRDP